MVHGPQIILYINIYIQRYQFAQLGSSLSSQSRGVCIWYHGYYSGLKCNRVCADILCSIRLWLGSNIEDNIIRASVMLMRK